MARKQKTAEQYYNQGGVMAVIAIIIVIASGWLLFPDPRENPIYPILKLIGMIVLMLWLMYEYKSYIEYKIQNSAFEN
jgi:low temperature requirement protein LtrA